MPAVATVVHHQHHEPKLDLRKIGIIALVKIGLAKLKAFGALKLLFLMLLKFKLFLLTIFIKFVFFLKALKLLKSLLIPFLLLSLLPLLALPLMALPALVPLLMMLPIFTVNVVPPAGGGRIRLPNALKMSAQHELATSKVAVAVDQVSDSQYCIERIACQVATKRDAKLLFPVVSW